MVRCGIWRCVGVEVQTPRIAIHILEKGYYVRVLYTDPIDYCDRLCAMEEGNCSFDDCGAARQHNLEVFHMCMYHPSQARACHQEYTWSGPRSSKQDYIPHGSSLDDCVLFKETRPGPSHWRAGLGRLEKLG
jgi:hypothetical protein